MGNEYARCSRSRCWHGDFSGRVAAGPWRPTSLEAVSFSDATTATSRARISTTMAWCRGPTMAASVACLGRCRTASWEAWRHPLDGGSGIPDQQATALRQRGFRSHWTEGRRYTLERQSPRYAYLSGGRRVMVGRPRQSGALVASSVGGAAWTPDFQGPHHLRLPRRLWPTTPNWNLSTRFRAAAPRGRSVQDRRPKGHPDPSLIFKTPTDRRWTTQTAPAQLARAELRCRGRRPDRLHRMRTEGDLAHDRRHHVDASRDLRYHAREGQGVDAWDANKVLIVGDGGKIAWTTNAGGTPTWKVNPAATANSLFGAQRSTRPTGSSWATTRRFSGPQTPARLDRLRRRSSLPASASPPSEPRFAARIQHHLDGGHVERRQGHRSRGRALRFQNKYGRYWNGSRGSPRTAGLVADKKRLQRLERLARDGHVPEHVLVRWGVDDQPARPTGGGSAGYARSARRWSGRRSSRRRTSGTPGPSRPRGPLPEAHGWIDGARSTSSSVGRRRAASTSRSRRPIHRRRSTTRAPQAGQRREKAVPGKVARRGQALGHHARHRLQRRTEVLTVH